MRLEDLSVAVRPRHHFEATDLGFLMLRRWWRSVYVAWFVTTLPVVLIACIGLRNHPEFIILAIWWFKPFYDRVVLHVLGAQVFGAKPGFKALLKFIPTTLKSDLLIHLTVGRVLLSRSFRLPVITLEGLRGSAYRARFKTLRQNVQGRAQLLTVVCVHLESFLWLGLFGLAYLLVPPTVELDWLEMISDGPPEFQYAMAGTWFIAMSIIEPAYVASGFALYLNRRTLLECWDLELGLRKMTRRLTAPSAFAARAAVLAAGLCMTAAMVFPGGASAQDYDQSPWWHADPRSPEDARVVASEVLAHEDFDTTITINRLFDFDSDEQDEDEDDESLFDPLFSPDAWVALATGIKGLFWILAIAGALFALYKLAPLLRGVRIQRPPSAGAAELEYGDETVPEPLGPNIAERATSAWRSGARRDALSLLYRGAVESLVDEHRLRVPEGATERDLLELVRASASADIQSMLAVLLRAWQQLVYAKRDVGDGDFEQILARWRAAMERQT